MQIKIGFLKNPAFGNLVLYSYSFERSENVLYAVAPLTGGKIQNAI